MPDQDLGRQRVEDMARRFERTVDERPHPPGLDAFVDRVDRYEATGVGTVVAAQVVLYDLDALGDELYPVSALHLAGDDDAGVS